MDKNIKEAIDLNGTMSISVHQGTILLRVYQFASQTKLEGESNLKVITNEIPHIGGDFKVELSSDIFEFETSNISIRGIKDYYIRGVFVWLLEKAMTYLATTAKEYETEVLITNQFNEVQGSFESYASLGDDVPVLLISITLEK
jgi:hypothetical protein